MHTANAHDRENSFNRVSVMSTHTAIPKPFSLCYYARARGGKQCDGSRSKKYCPPAICKSEMGGRRDKDALINAPLVSLIKWKE